MAVAFDKSTGASTVATVTSFTFFHTFPVGDFAVVGVSNGSFFATGPNNPSGVTFAGSSMTLVDSDSIQAIPTGAFFNTSLWRLFPSTVGGVNAVTITWPAFALTPGAWCMTFTGAGSAGTGGLKVSQFCSPGPCPSSISVAASAQSMVCDIMSKSLVPAPVPGAGQTVPSGIPAGTSSGSYETGSGGTNIMSWTLTTTSLATQIVQVIDPPVVVTGFDGVTYTAEGTNRPEEPGFPGAPAFPSFGVTGASPYDSLKKSIQVEALLNNAKFI